MDPILITERQIHNKQDTAYRALQKRFPVDLIDIKDIIYNPSKTVNLPNGDFRCTFTYKGEQLIVEPGSLFFDQVTSPADSKILTWHHQGKILELIDEICRVGNVVRKNVVVEKANEKSKILSNLQMPGTLQRSLVKTMTLSINSRRFKVEFRDEWDKIMEIKNNSKYLLSMKYRPGLLICPNHVVNAALEKIKDVFQMIFPFRAFSEGIITSSSPRKADDTWDLFFYDVTNLQFLVQVNAIGVATCREEFVAKPPKALLELLKTSGHTEIRVTSCVLNEGKYELFFQPERLQELKGYCATIREDGSEFTCLERSLGPSWIDE